MLTDTDPKLSVIVSGVTNEYMRFLSKLYQVSHPYSKPIYGGDLIAESIFRKSVGDTIILELPLCKDGVVPTSEIISIGNKPLTGHECKAASLAFRSFDESKGIFKSQISLPLIKHKEMYEKSNSYAAIR